MKAKMKLGMGIRKSEKKRKAAKKKKKVSLRHIVGAVKAVNNASGRNRVRSQRILPVPSEIGGILPFLIPLFAGLSATGTLAGGVAGIVKAVNDAKSAKRDLEESERQQDNGGDCSGQRSVPETLEKRLGSSSKKRVKLPHRALTHMDLL